MSCRNALICDETRFAAHAAISAPRRKSLAPPCGRAYSAPIDTVHRPERKDRTMNATYTTTLQTRLVAFAVAVLTSAVVLGSTVAGMQPDEQSSTPVVALERVTITATRTN
jgi:hypothetical protein